MEVKKLHFVSSENTEAKKAKKLLIDEYNDFSAAEADVIIALGGDGLMLQTLHENIKQSKPIFGMNRGSVGFLMNDYNQENLIERVNTATLTKDVHRASADVAIGHEHPRPTSTDQNLRLALPVAY